MFITTIRYVYFPMTEYPVVAILREDVRGGDELADFVDLDHLPEVSSHEQRLQEGQHRRRDR